MKNRLQLRANWKLDFLRIAVWGDAKLKQLKLWSDKATDSEYKMRSKGIDYPKTTPKHRNILKISAQKQFIGVELKFTESGVFGKHLSEEVIKK